MPTAPEFHQEAAVLAPDSPAFVTPRTTGATTTEAFTLPYRAAYVVIENLETDPAKRLRWGWTQNAVETNNVYNVIKGGRAVAIPEILSAKKIWVRTEGDAVEWQAFIRFTRQPFRATHPDMTLANGYPEFDDSTVTDIQPGIDTP